MSESKALQAALSDLSELVDGLRSVAPDGLPDWKSRKVAAMGLRDLMDGGKIHAILNDLIAEAESHGE